MLAKYSYLETLHLKVNDKGPCKLEYQSQGKYKGCQIPLKCVETENISTYQNHGTNDSGNAHKGFEMVPMVQELIFMFK